MPHSTKKKRRAVSSQSQPARKSTPSRRNLYIVVGVVAAIIAAASGVALYYSYHTTTVSQGTLVYANFDTSQGSFEVELFQGLVPATVNNFVSLAKSGFYNNLVWHRIVKNFVIQTGDPNTRNGGGNPCSQPDEWGTGGSSNTIPFEYAPSLHNYAGYLGMASSAAKTGGSSQFYINLSNSSTNLALDGDYAVFGKIISFNGLLIANKIGNLPTNPSCTTSEGGPPANPSEAMLLSVTILNSTSTTTT
jgi:cyclophilin family peptidyl-prolyl cis-trans isomerase